MNTSNGDHRNGKCQAQGETALCHCEVCQVRNKLDSYLAQLRLEVSHGGLSTALALYYLDHTILGLQVSALEEYDPLGSYLPPHARKQLWR